MNQEKLNLTWHTYTDHVREMLHHMMSSNELTDITLVSADKKKFKAHKVVLSSCSSVFKSIINDTLLSDAIIYLTGIQSSEIESILKLIYLGEAILHQERMDEFINATRSLEIKEIGKDIEIPENDQHDIHETQEIGHYQKKLPKTQKTSIVINHNKSRQFNLSNENNYPCDKCDYKASYASHIRQHIKSIHERVKYPCEQCNYRATDQSGLRKHIKSIHEGLKYPCPYQCNFRAFFQLSKLQQHIRSHHVEESIQ